MYCVESSYEQESQFIFDNEEVLVIEVRPSPIHSDQIIEKESDSNHYICKQMFLKLVDEESELLVQLVGHPSCEIFLEMKTPQRKNGTKTRYLS